MCDTMTQRRSDGKKSKHRYTHKKRMPFEFSLSAFSLFHIWNIAAGATAMTNKVPQPS